jgi:hypothetical protein
MPSITTGPTGWTGWTGLAGFTGGTGPTGQTGPAFSGTLTSTLAVQQLQEVVVVFTNSSSTFTLDWSTADVFYLANAVNANISLTLSNVPTTTNRNYSVVVYMSNGATGGYISALTIGATSTTIRWPLATTPTPTANVYAMQAFTIYYNGTTWFPFAQYTNFSA